MIPIRFLLVLSFGILFSCAPRQESPKTLAKEKFIEVYIAVIRGDGRPNLRNTTNSASRTTLAAVLTRYGTNEEQFWATVDSYRSEPEKWKAFFEDVTKRLQAGVTNGDTTRVPSTSQ